MEDAFRGLLRSARILASPSSAYYSAVQAEPEVDFKRCTFLGSCRIGYRSYCSESLLRHVTIGRFCSIGRRCSIGAALHSTRGITTHPFGAPEGWESDPPTVVGHDVWIGDNVIVVAGVTIGDGAVVGGGAVVTKDVEPYAIVAGVPAREISRRASADDASALQRLAWWRYGDQCLTTQTRSDLKAALTCGVEGLEAYEPGYSALRRP